MPGGSATRVGGAAGNAIRKNGVEVTVLNGGQIYGEAY
jgi:TRAP-type mannitol/chloroaromatic compound transport system substrate-binding protein